MIRHTIYTEFEPMPRADKLFCWVVGAVGLLAVALRLAGVIA